MLSAASRAPGRPGAAPTSAPLNLEGSDDTCAICLNQVGDASSEMGVARLTCGHLFHPCCISAWFGQRAQPLCPVCRTREASVNDGDSDAPGPRRAGPSVFVMGRNAFQWVLLHQEVCNMAIYYGYYRFHSLTGLALPSFLLSTVWTMLLVGCLPRPRIDRHPLNALLGTQSTPQFIRMWTSWI